MKKNILLISLLIAGLSSTAAKIPVSATVSIDLVNTLNRMSTLSIAEVQKLAGNKLSLKEKLGFKIWQWKLRKELKKKGPVPGRKGRTAKFLAIFGLATLVIPMIGLFTAAICSGLALILGYDARKADPDDRNAQTAITIGWITLSVMAVLTMIIIAYLTSFSFSWA